ncbi:MAG: hypothetical protein QOD75_2061 [Blastocatellia bacterium]|jgi:hypothetical protein|nr:hypothetical protein [Blastocatellia bacterium]
MPARKPPKKSAKKSSTKAAAKGKPLDLKAVSAGRIVLYGIPIRDAIKRGDVSEMRQLAAVARRHVSDVQTALDELEKSIGK